VSPSSFAQSLVAKLKAARDRKIAQGIKCGGRRSYAERSPKLVVAAKALQISRITHFEGQIIGLFDGLPTGTSRAAVESTGGPFIRGRVIDLSPAAGLDWGFEVIDGGEELSWQRVGQLSSSVIIRPVGLRLLRVEIIHAIPAGEGRMRASEHNRPGA
jgi:hypothetical protein